MVKRLMLVLFFLFFVLAYALVRRFERRRLYALCKVLTFGTLFVYLVTELCSVLSIVTAGTLGVVYGAADLILVILQIRFRERKIVFPKRDRTSWILVATFGAFSLCMLFLALSVIPYNWDSMTYHLTRIVAWAQNRSISHFATTITRCVGSPVLGEVMGLQIWLLGGAHDRLLNLTQCLSFLINALLVYGITRKIGGNRGISTLAVVLFVTTPIAFAESLTTQVDEFATIFLLIFVYVILDPIRDGAVLDLSKREGREILLLLAVSAALGYLAKPSVMVGMGVFTLWLLIRCLRRKESGRLTWTWILCTAGLALVLILPELARNLVTYHAISDPWQGKGQLVHTGDPRLLFISFLKNLFFNLPCVFWPDLGTFLIKVVYKTGLILHVDVDSEAISEYGRAYSLNGAGDYGCDSAVSPLITMAMLICVLVFAVHLIVWLLRGRRGKRVWTGVGYSTVAVLTYFLMCVIIRWEPWIGRYLLSYLALLCPAVAIQVQKVDVRYGRPVLCGMAAGILVFTSAFEGVNMVQDKVSMIQDQQSEDKEEAYFWNNPSAYGDLYVPLTTALDGMELPEKVGLYTGGSSFLYPVLRYLQSRGSEGVFVLGDGGNEKYEDLSFTPDLILVMDVPMESETMEIHGCLYTVLDQVSDACVILEKVQR